MQKGDRQLDRSGLFGRVVSILEISRANVVRSVNSEMFAAYWLIDHEIVEEIQKGEGRGGYAKECIEKLSSQLNERFGRIHTIAWLVALQGANAGTSPCSTNLHRRE